MARSAPLWTPFARPRVPNNGARTPEAVLVKNNSIPSVVCVVGRIRRAARFNKVGGGHLHRVSTAAMAENLKDLRLEDGIDGAAAAATSENKVC